VTAERVELEAPLDAPFRGVIRLVVAGIAEQAAFGYEALDDLQLAVERLLAEAGGEGRVQVSFELLGNGVRVRVGPLRAARIEALLDEQVGETGTLTLRRILSTVVDCYVVEDVGDGEVDVELEKLGPPRP